MFGIVPLAKVRALWGLGWQPWALGVGEASNVCSARMGIARAPLQLGSSTLAFALPECPAAWGNARGGGDTPSEIRCQCARLTLQPEEKQKATQQFSKLQTAMKVLGISPDEQKACWFILAAIYHLGAAGATKGNLQWVPTAWLVARETLWGPSHSQFVLTKHRLICYQTPLFCCAASQAPTSEQKAPNTQRSISANDGLWPGLKCQ